MKIFLINALVCASLLLLRQTTGLCQTDTIGNKPLTELSLKDLLGLKIQSVSKASELLFDAPLSASVVTREEIRRTGCTSIMEALRLVPGMIVREQSNGNYDIHLRGMDNVPPNTSFDFASTTMLVMIDNRPIYSYLRGGTFWETLPVDINDVETIEVVRGSAAALYGPNAVNGVINILTRQPAKKGIYALANVAAGSFHTFINNGSLGYQGKNWGVIASGNYQHRDRTQTSYYNFQRDAWFDHPAYLIDFQSDTVNNIQERFPRQSLAMEKYAGNLFLNYSPKEKVKLQLAAGTQRSMVQKVSAENELTPLSTGSSNSRYVDFHAVAFGFSSEISYNKGTQNVDYDPGNKFDFDVFDGSVEYNYTHDKLSLKPGLSYHSAVYDDTKYSDFEHRRGIFNTRGLITTWSGSLRGEYRAWHNRVRLVAAIAASKFNYPDKTYASYELACTYKVSKNNLIRVVSSRAPRSSAIFDTYADQAVVFFPSGPNRFTEVALLGNKNIDLLTARLFEVGYRSQIGSHFKIDAELFTIGSKNFIAMVESHPIIEYDGTDTIFETPYISTNLPLVLRQNGLTVSGKYENGNLQLSAFVTFQHTQTKNYAASLNSPDADIPGAAQNNIYSAMGKKETLASTPKIFGGGALNYAVCRKLNLNLSSYFYTAQKYYHLSNLIFHDGIRGIDNIGGKLLINASLSYEPIKSLHVFCTGKNLLNDRSRQFFKADDTPFMMMAGVNFEL